MLKNIISVIANGVKQSLVEIVKSVLNSSSNAYFFYLYYYLRLFSIEQVGNRAFAFFFIMINKLRLFSRLSQQIKDHKVLMLLLGLLLS